MLSFLLRIYDLCLNVRIPHNGASEAVRLPVKRNPHRRIPVSYTHLDVYKRQALDAENGAAKLARLLIEECTDLNLFVGRALNPAHQNSNLPFDLSVRMNLVEQLKDCAERMGKHVTVKYY